MWVDRTLAFYCGAVGNSLEISLPDTRQAVHTAERVLYLTLATLNLYHGAVHVEFAVANLVLPAPRKECLATGSV